MKRSLHLSFLTVIITSFIFLNCSNGQSVVFSEDFSGFTTGTHSSPSTYDYSASLDSKTVEPGWTGYKVYSAGGEIKMGTASVPGWIKTPSVDLSGTNGTAILSFDISRWPDDETSVQVYLNDTPIGYPLEPDDEFQTIEFSLAEAGSSCSIKFESLSERFYLDNIRILNENVTYITNYETDENILIYPNPAHDYINLKNLTEYNKLDIIDLSAKVVRTLHLYGNNNVQLSLSGIPAGFYIIEVSGSKRIVTSVLIKND